MGHSEPHGLGGRRFFGVTSAPVELDRCFHSSSVMAPRKSNADAAMNGVMDSCRSMPNKRCDQPGGLVARSSSGPNQWLLIPSPSGGMYTTVHDLLTLQPALPGVSAALRLTVPSTFYSLRAASAYAL